MNINYFALSMTGKKSDVNEDYFFIPDKITPQKIGENGHLFAVCDGVGGYSAGEVASFLTIKYLQRDFYRYEKRNDLQKWLLEEIRSVNTRIIEHSHKRPEYHGMGTTLVNLVIKQNTAYINNCGDSRLYLFNQTLSQITEDHSLVWNLFRKGIITKDEIIKHKQKNIITTGIGIEKEPAINSYKIELPPKFLFLLCSDGLTDVAADSAVSNILTTASDLQKCCYQLYDLSQQNNSHDDVTIILVSNYLEK